MFDTMISKTTNFQNVELDLEYFLTPQIFGLYQSVTQNSVLANQTCYLAVEQNRGYDYDSAILFEGSVTECFREVPKYFDEFHIIYVLLPIGETVYNLAEFVYRGEDIGYVQQSFLSKNIIEKALITVEDVIEHEIQLVENDEFVSDDILNSLLRLSEESYLGRFENNSQKPSLFEQIKAEIDMAGSVVEALKSFYEPSVDLSTRYNKARLKALLQLI